MDEQGYSSKRTFSDYQLFDGKRPLLSHLDIELTERCNNACLHCYINLPEDDTRAAAKELDARAWQHILAQAADLGARSVRFTGGEPLLHPDFPAIYLHARRLGMKVLLFTNARLITPKIADLFAQVPPLKKLEVSVYGMHPESYDVVVCTPGAFYEFRRGLDLLLDRQVPFVLKSVLLPPNRNEIDEFEAWAATIPWMDYNPRYAIFLNLRARRDSPAKNRLIRKLRFSPEEGLALLTRDEQAYRREMAQYIQAGFMRPQGDDLFTCGAGESGCVDAYGHYQMCMPLRHTDTVFDLKEYTLRQVLTQEFPRLQALKATNPSFLDRCTHCFLQGLCEQCPAKSWMEHGTLDTPVEYLCQIAHIQARFLGLLENGEDAWEVQNWQQRTKIFVRETLGADFDASAIPAQSIQRGHG